MTNHVSPDLNLRNVGKLCKMYKTRGVRSIKVNVAHSESDSCNMYEKS